ncbi:ABC transporter ATP-binding protein [Rhodococcus sp. BP-252]|uniref:ABC transporter ATP-binding protein n=1 Tax=unclassified Rhodococcus (in: high G+C Gram-positive bacteria) TaxID=192944 RepID=UPI001C9AC162|nr:MULTISPECIES: ABC transporter ATP-binding protein [unclassified Rhodococcus (in: high G+C Gram-positive bacteria)]MBY6412852.1 ABC transporter ATP-binding protein [Rhodococcus sp. BP-320]MBY6417611.1 ABC transporter ATP-binding protein [Rhodococcus sp. BP-321]MBY6423463.1 ABC transporter ATP-binding protein [Rhodococcus sp. BP-324]MBY6427635.1 ABC transporter ATP-binding protein [Rhodococcus sp. BP-323]MBY6432799.1 ABC transporter ATP-binding protein [Rhodococcus sp. BP-322]
MIDATHVPAAEVSNSAASLRGITVEYPRPGAGGSVKALDDVNFTVKEGELLVLVGRSGSGKTTALNVLAGLVEPTSGECQVLDAEPVRARSRMSYMFARDGLLPWRTAVQNVEFALEVRGTPKGERTEISRHFLGMVGLSDRMQNYPAQMSHGQRQRVALARTWATSPEVLLMDEPFAALDTDTREVLQAEFVRMWQQDRRSVAFVTHDLNEAVILADRILVFAHAKIVEEFEVSLPRPRDLLELSASSEGRSLIRSVRDCIAAS